MDNLEQTIFDITDRARTDLFVENLGLVWPETKDLAKLPRKAGEVLSLLSTLNKRIRGYASEREARDAMWIIAGRHAQHQKTYGLEKLWHNDKILEYFNIAR